MEATTAAGRTRLFDRIRHPLKIRLPGKICGCFSLALVLAHMFCGRAENSLRAREARKQKPLSFCILCSVFSVLYSVPVPQTTHFPQTEQRAFYSSSGVYAIPWESATAS